MITLHFHLHPQFKYELFHIYFTVITGHFGLCLGRNCRGISTLIISEKLRFQILFVPKNAKPVVSDYSGLKSVLKKFRCHDGLVCMVESKLRFPVSLAYCGLCISVISCRFVFKMAGSRAGLRKILCVRFTDTSLCINSQSTFGEKAPQSTSWKNSESNRGP